MDDPPPPPPSSIAADPSSPLPSAMASSTSDPSPPPAPPPPDTQPKQESLKKLVDDRDWSAIDQQLRKILLLKEKGQDHARVHPHLFLPVYDQWITDHIRKNEPLAAFKVFVDKVAGICKAEGEFVADENLVKTELNRLHLVANEKGEIPDVPTSSENMYDILSDYLDLYFPDLTGHDRACEGYNHLWSFAKRLEKPKKQKHPNFKCLACGALFKSCTITKMRNHLAGKGAKICRMLTENMRSRFEDGERKNSQNQGVRSVGGHGKSAGPLKPSEKGGIVKHAPTVTEENENVKSLADMVITAIQRLHAAAVGKTLDPEVTAGLKSAKDILDQIVP